MLINLSFLDMPMACYLTQTIRGAAASIVNTNCVADALLIVCLRPLLIRII